MLYFGRSPWMLQAVFALRQAVFVEEQHIPIDWEFDEKDQTCPYFLWLDGRIPIATIRYQFSSPNTLQPDRFCVAEAYRYQGYGTKLLHYLEMRGVQEGALQSVLSAEIDACAFYESCGYQKKSEPYTEDGVLCVEMTKQLKTAVKEE